MLRQEPYGIAIFVSGSGTNAENIIRYFQETQTVYVKLVVCSNPTAPAIERAAKLGIPVVIVDKKTFEDTDAMLNFLLNNRVHWIVLAGFLWLVPAGLLRYYPNKIINLHPSLLPKYGGKGMYGMRVHEAVKANNETETGITIHYVNAKYDEGNVIFQKSCWVHEEDTLEQIAQNVHELEYECLPKVIEALILNKPIPTFHCRDF